MPSENWDLSISAGAFEALSNFGSVASEGSLAPALLIAITCKVSIYHLKKSTTVIRIEITDCFRFKELYSVHMNANAVFDHRQKIISLN